MKTINKNNNIELSVCYDNSFEDSLNPAKIREAELKKIQLKEWEAYIQSDIKVSR